MPPVMDPPSPDESSWDFLDPFRSYDKYYETYVPNTSFRKVREEEGIPELEEVKDEIEYVVPASASKKIEKEKEEQFVDDKLNSVKGRDSSVGERGVRSGAERSVRGSFENEVHAKRKERDAEEEVHIPARNFHDDSEVLLEIKQQFERAADVAGTVAGLLEAGKRHYQFKDSIRKGQQLNNFYILQ